jgi:hypothetical protein
VNIKAAGRIKKIARPGEPRIADMPYLVFQPAKKGRQLLL